MKDDKNVSSDQDPDLPSKSERKRELSALKQQSFRLVELTDGALEKLPLWPELKDALALARRLPSTGARKRQVQFIAKQLRGDEGQAVIDALTELDNNKAGDVQRFHELEQLREQLLVADDPIALAVSRYPDAERSRIRQLVRDTKAERGKNQPPKNSRKLFKYLRELDDYQGDC